LYAYVRNNPLRYTDPSGTYYCSGTSEQCDKMAAAYLWAAGAATSKDLSKQQKAAKFLGKPGEANGGVVAFGAEPKHAGGGLWNPSWPAAEAEGTRQRAIRKNAQESVRTWCQNGGDCK